MTRGSERFDALRAAVKERPANGPLRISLFDGLDLGKLTVYDLTACGFDKERAEAIIADLRRGSLDEVGKAVGAELEIGPASWDDDETLEEMFETLDRIRHPERYPQRL